MSAVKKENHVFSIKVDGEPISLEFDEHFYLASTSPALSMINKGVGYPDPDYTFYQAHRLDSEAVVEGLNVIGVNTREDLMAIWDDLQGFFTPLGNERGYLKHVHQRETMLPAGSLILHEANKGFDDPGSWFGVTPHEQRLTNFARVGYKIGEGKVVCADRWIGDSAGAACRGAADQFYSLRGSDGLKDAHQTQAHIADVMKMDRLGMLPKPWL